jgi:hypothetical protein
LQEQPIATRLVNRYCPQLVSVFGCERRQPLLIRGLLFTPALPFDNRPSDLSQIANRLQLQPCHSYHTFETTTSQSLETTTRRTDAGHAKGTEPAACAVVGGATPHSRNIATAMVWFGRPKHPTFCLLWTEPL